MAITLTKPLLPRLPGESEAGWTWSAYRDLLGEQPDLAMELIEGELSVSPAPNTSHQRIALHIARCLSGRIEDPGLGQVLIAPYDMRLDDDSAPQPDVLMVLNAHLDRITDTHLEGPADLVVEVLSPYSHHRDLRRKRALYADHRIPEYWIADPDARTLTVFRHDGRFYPDAPAWSGTDMVLTGLIPGPAMAVEWWLGKA